LALLSLALWGGLLLNSALRSLTLHTLSLCRVATTWSLVQVALALAGSCLLALVPVAGSGLTGLALHVTLGLVPVS
jgi:hypothetical protein